MDLYNILTAVVNPGLALLPKEMTSLQAKAMLLAIGLQESRFIYRKQINGPARGFYQFEKDGGIKGVLQHASTKPFIKPILKQLGYAYSVELCYNAVNFDDPLATVFARLLLWTLPDALPEKQEHELAWQQYIEAWRPGKPHRHTWNDFYNQAWEVVV